jgi:hypothetical protein
MFFPVFRARTLHSAELSKLKPFGISIQRRSTSFWRPMHGRLVSNSTEEQPMFTRLIQICSTLLFACILTTS